MYIYSLPDRIKQSKSHTSTRIHLGRYVYSPVSWFLLRVKIDTFVRIWGEIGMFIPFHHLFSLWKPFRPPADHMTLCYRKKHMFILNLVLVLRENLHITHSVFSKTSLPVHKRFYVSNTHIIHYRELNAGQGGAVTVGCTVQQRQEFCRHHSKKKEVEIDSFDKLSGGNEVVSLRIGYW